MSFPLYAALIYGGREVELIYSVVFTGPDLQLLMF